MNQNQKKISDLLKEMAQLLPATWPQTDDEAQQGLRRLVLQKIEDAKATLPKS